MSKLRAGEQGKTKNLESTSFPTLRGWDVILAGKSVAATETQTATHHERAQRGRARASLQDPLTRWLRNVLSWLPGCFPFSYQSIGSFAEREYIGVTGVNLVPLFRFSSISPGPLHMKPGKARSSLTKRELKVSHWSWAQPVVSRSWLHPLMRAQCLHLCTFVTG